MPIGQPLYGQPMQPQPVQGQSYPVMNNYAITGQPTNTTQSGVDMNYLRQQLANMIATNASLDAAAGTLYRAAAGNNGNWMTAKMDNLTHVLQMTLDVMWRTNSVGKNIDQLIAEAINEVWHCAWANMVELEPALSRDPSLNGSRLSVMSQWSQVMRQRTAQFNQMGLLQNNGVVNTPHWNTATYAQQPPAWQNNMQMQAPALGYQPSQPFQNTSVPNGQLGGIYGRSNTGQWNAGQPAHPQRSARDVMYASVAQSQPTQQWAPAPQTQPQQGQRLPAGGLFTQGQSQATQPQQNNQPTNSRSIYGTVARHANYKGPVDRYGIPIPEDQLKEEDKRDVVSSINQVPPRTSLLDRVQGTSVVTPTTPSTPTTDNMGEVSSFKVEPMTQVDFNDDKAMEKLFRDLVDSEKVEARDKTLRSDEVGYLTEETLWEHYEKGTKFESPFYSPIAVNPNRFHYFALLTKENTVRQEIVPLETTMERDIHKDLLAQKRNDWRNQADAYATRTLTSAYNVSTMGGIVYDPFKAAKVTLNEGLKKAADANEEERELLLLEAFDKFKVQALQDLRDERSGLAEARARYTTEDDAEGDEYVDSMSPEEREQIYQRRTARIKSVDLSKEMKFPTNIQEVNSAMLVNSSIVGDNSSVLGDKITQEEAQLLISNEGQLLHMTLTPEERKAILEELNDFIWVDDITDENREEEDKRTAMVLAVKLRQAKGKVPVNVWNYINRIATDEVNHQIKHTLGLDYLDIDSYADDYHELIEHLYDRHEKDRPNIQQGISVMNTQVAQRIRLIHETATDLELIDEFGNNHIPLRGIATTTNTAVLRLPTLPSAFGLDADVNYVNVMTDEGLHSLLKDLTIRQIASRVNRKAFNTHIHRSYVLFSDNSYYRIFTNIGQAPEKYEDDTNFFNQFTLVRVKNV